MSDQPTEPQEPEPTPEPDEEPSHEGPSSHETSGQFPADDVRGDA